MKEIILRKSISLSILSAIIFISIGVLLIYYNNNRFGLMARKGESIGGIFIIVFSIRLLIDILLYKRRYVLINSAGIHDHSSILFSGSYYWNKIIKLEVTQTNLRIDEGHSCWKIYGLNISQDTLKLITDYREKYMKQNNI